MWTGFVRTAASLPCERSPKHAVQHRANIGPLPLGQSGVGQSLTQYLRIGYLKLQRRRAHQEVVGILSRQVGSRREALEVLGFERRLAICGGQTGVRISPRAPCVRFATMCKGVSLVGMRVMSRFRASGVVRVRDGDYTPESP